MKTTGLGLAVRDERRDPREEVYFRTRALTADGQPVELLVVNVSARGLMARVTRDDLVIGDRLSLRLPAVGTLTAEIRWSLGGRIGIEFADVIQLAAYLGLLAEVLKR